MNRNYDANSIEVLDGLDAIRKRPDMYIGATTGKFSPGLYRILREVIDNSLDEFLGGHSKNLSILLDTKSNSVAVIDDGRGIPTGMNSKLGMDALTAVFTKVHSGGKFDHNVYKTSSGKNGVGITALNALSEWLIAYSNNNSKRVWMHQKFKRGVPDGDVAKGACDDLAEWVKDTGTIVRFKPDEKIFRDGIELDVNRLDRELEDLKYLCPGLHIKTNIDGRETEYFSENGLRDMVAEHKPDEKIFSFTADNIDAAICFTKREGTSFKSFVNNVYTDMGGTHLKGFRRCICDIIKENSKKSITNDDILEGMVAAIHFKMSDPQYQGQTKNELTSVEAEDQVIDLLDKPLRKFFKENKALLDHIVKYAEKMYDERQKMKASKEMLKGLNKLNNAARYISDKFSDADRRKYRNIDDLEMFVVEGDSAGGHFKQAREGFQACLKLRGKIINAAKATQTDLFGSQKKGSEKDGNREIKDLTAALGCGVLEQYDERKLRFSKLILMCFTGDTKVKMLDGTEKSFEELVAYEKEHPDSEYWVYSVDERGSFVPGCAKHPRITGYADELVEITLDNGTSFKCTPDHLLMLRDGSYKEARDVTNEDSLMPLYTKINDGSWNTGRELYYDNSTNSWEFTHRSVMKKIFRNAENDEHVHHIDRNILNNEPSNLQILSAEDHRQLHANDHAEHGRDVLIRYNKSKEHKDRISYLWHNTDTYDNATFGKNGYNGSEKHIADLKRAFADGRLTSKHLTDWNLTEEARKLHSDLISKSNRDEKINQTRRLNRMLNIGSLLKIDGYELSEALFEDKTKVKSITGSTIKLTAILKKFGTFDAYASAVENHLANADDDTKARIESLRNSAKDTLQNRRSGNVLTKKNSMARIGKLIFDRGLEFNSANYSKIRKELGAVRTPLFDRYDKYYDSYENFREYCQNYNHKIISKRLIKLDSPAPVYDLTVDKYHNFVLGGGSQIVVHNCDADVDGLHITNLVLAFLIKYMPDLIKNGHVYTIDAPLFLANGANDRVYGNSRNEVEQKMKKLGCKQFTITRLKGWGECDAEDLSTLCISPKTRKLIQMKWDDEVVRTLEKTMGKEGRDDRKELLGVS